MKYDGPAGAIQDAADSIESTHPGPAAAGVIDRHSAFESRYLCHYAADALHRSDRALLAKHVAWSRERFTAAGGSAEAFDSWIAEIDQALRPIGLASDFF
jgi:hypothetical protein